MKKFKMKKAVSVLLAAAMTVSLAACGGGKTETDSSLAKQFVYSYENVDVPELTEGTENGSADITGMAYVNDRVYIVYNLMDWSTMPSKLETKLTSFLADGSDVQTVDLPLGTPSEEEEAPNGEEQTQSGESAEGEASTPEIQPRVAESKAAVPLPTPEVDAGDTADIPLKYEEKYINNMVMTNGGIIYAVVNTSRTDNTDPQNPIYENAISLLCWDTSGSLLWEKPITDFMGEAQDSYINNIFAAKDDGLCVMMGGSKNLMVILDKAGEITTEQVLDDNFWGNNGGTYALRDGRLLISEYNEDWTKMTTYLFDTATGTKGEEVTIPDRVTRCSIRTGVDTDFVLTDSNGVYTYNMGDTDVTQIMSFVNSDLNSSNLQQVVMVDDTHFAAVYSDSDWKSQVAVFTKVNPEDIPDKEVLLLGCVYLDNSVRNRIIDFNKSNPKYRITIKDYSQYATMEDWMASYTQMNNDIVSGQMPDILVNTQNMPTENYIAKGLLADVGKMIEEDEELSQEEFLENVFRTYSVDGKLYQIIPNFSITSFIGKTSLVGDRSGWTMADFQEVLAQNPDINAFGETTRDGFIWNVVRYGGTQFIDRATGKCNFDSEEFISLMEYAKTLPEEIQNDAGEGDWETYWEEYQSQYIENRTLLKEVYIGRIADLNRDINGYFNEPVSFIGFPVAEGNGSVINYNQSFSISAKSANQEGAWEFLRYYLTDEYQESDEWYGMPVNKERFMELAQQALEKPFYLDQDGNKVEYEDTVYINGENVPLEPMSQEQLDRVVEFVMSVERSGYYNENVQNIITEETAAFFEGQKTAQEVAKIIQSRIQIYVDESR